MGRGPRAVVIAEPSNCSLVEEFDPFDGAVQPEADVDLEPGIMGVDFISLGTSLEGFFVLCESLLQAFDAFGSGSLLVV